MRERGERERRETWEGLEMLEELGVVIVKIIPPKHPKSWMREKRKEKTNKQTNTVLRQNIESWDTQVTILGDILC